LRRRWGAAARRPQGIKGNDCPRSRAADVVRAARHSSGWTLTRLFHGAGVEGWTAVSMVKRVLVRFGSTSPIPGPLRFLIFLSLGSVLFVPASIFSDNVTVDGHVVGHEWWTNGSGYLFLASLTPFVCSGVLMLRRIRHARAVHIVGWSLIYVSGFLVSRINSGPSTDAWSYAAWGVAQTAVVAGYLYFSKRVRAYFSGADPA